eukprot:364097-Chlamydomonas_euryale.AAC.5
MSYDVHTCRIKGIDRQTWRRPESLHPFQTGRWHGRVGWAGRGRAGRAERYHCRCRGGCTTPMTPARALRQRGSR